MGVLKLEIQNDLLKQTAASSRKPDTSHLAVIDTIRSAHLECRVKPRSDLFKSCEMLSFDRDAAHAAYTESLVRHLPQILGKKPVLYRPGEPSLSFDEAWILALLSAYGNDDAPTKDFLLGSRVKHHYRLKMGFLCSNLARLFGFGAHVS